MENVIAKARSYLDLHRGERITLTQLARAVGASPFHLQRRFKESLGLSPGDYQREAHTRCLWVVEGWTSYYDRLFVRRELVRDLAPRGAFADRSQRRGGVETADADAAGDVVADRREVAAARAHALVRVDQQRVERRHAHGPPAGVARCLAVVIWHGRRRGGGARG